MNPERMNDLIVIWTFEALTKMDEDEIMAFVSKCAKCEAVYQLQTNNDCWYDVILDVFNHADCQKRILYVTPQPDNRDELIAEQYTKELEEEVKTMLAGPVLVRAFIENLLSEDLSEVETREEAESVDNGNETRRLHVSDGAKERNEQIQLDKVAVVNHEEAFEHATAIRELSNTARCYLELHARVKELEAQTPSALKAKLESAEQYIKELEALTEKTGPTWPNVAEIQEIKENFSNEFGLEDKCAIDFAYAVLAFANTKVSAPQAAPQKKWS